MLSSISKFFESNLKLKDEEAPLTSTATVDKLHLASAALMIELCKADHSVDPVETKTLLHILESEFGLSENTLDQLVSLAEEESKQATSLYQFTSLIHEGYDYPQKKALIKYMWKIAYADGNIDKYEEHLIRQVAELTYVSHKDFIKAKHEARDG